MVNVKVVAAVIAGAAIFVAGYQYASALYGEDIAALREDYATRAQSLEAKYREKERQNAAAVVAAWEERDRALADAVSLRSELDGVRDEAAALRRQLSRSPADSCTPCRAELAECAGLLARGSELLERGANLAQEVAADKDAVVRMTK